ncbi:MAG: hypothetical protein LBT99_02665 [Bifidobacteriaceae bacterium]|jgi:hypothetical protein|nr:hypothetical protein [Bifidobacteriaceae bacterium]
MLKAVYKVAFINRTFPQFINSIYYYNAPPNMILSVGSVVRVPFANYKQLLYGVILEKLSTQNKVYNNKTIDSLVNGVFLPVSLLNFFQVQAKKYNIAVSNLFKYNIPKFNDSWLDNINRQLNKPQQLSQINFQLCAKLYKYLLAGNYDNLQRIFFGKANYNLQSLPGVAEYNGRFYHLQTLLLALKIARSLLDKQSLIVTLPYQRYLDLLVDYLKQLGARFSDFEILSDIAVFNDSENSKDYFYKWLQVLYGKSGVVIGTKKSTYSPLNDFDCAITLDEQDFAHKSGYKPYNNLALDLIDRANLQSKPILSISAGFFSRSYQSVNFISANIKNLRSDRTSLEFKNFNTNDKSAKDLTDISRLPHKAYEALKQASSKGSVLVIVASKLGKAGTKSTYDWFKKAFANTLIKVSAKNIQQGVISQVDNYPQIVISTLGAAPVAVSGWQAIFILEANSYFNYKDVNFKSILSSWMNAISFIKLSSQSTVWLIKSVPDIALQTLKKWQPQLLDLSDNNLQSLQASFDSI